MLWCLERARRGTAVRRLRVKKAPRAGAARVDQVGAVREVERCLAQLGRLIEAAGLTAAEAEARLGWAPGGLERFLSRPAAAGLAEVCAVLEVVGAGPEALFAGDDGGVERTASGCGERRTAG